VVIANILQLIVPGFNYEATYSPYKFNNFVRPLSQNLLFAGA